MAELQAYVPLIVSIVSAASLLVGYVYQKKKEREVDIRRTRQEIYSRLVTTITQRHALMEHISRSPEWSMTSTSTEQYNLVLNNPAYAKALSDIQEIAALLCLYGHDDAIRAYSNYVKQSWDFKKSEYKNPNFGELVLALRKSIYPDTNATEEDANTAILNQYTSPP